MIKIEFKKKIRNNQVGDYYYDKQGNLTFEVKDQGNHDYNMLILLHEMIEYTLTQSRGTTIEDIDEWDNIHFNVEEPGEMVDSPYYLEHMFAENVERQMCVLMGIDWKTYYGSL